MSKKIYRTVVVTLLLLSGSYFAKANTFTAVLSGNWNTPATWGQLLNVPTASDIVIIPKPYTVTVNTTTAVASSVTINSGGGLTISAGDKLTVTGAVFNAGSVSIGTGSSLLIGGNLTNSGPFSTNAGTLTVTGNTSNSGNLSVTTGTLTATGTMSSSGVLSVTTGNIVLGSSLTNSGTMTVAANGKLTFSGAANSTITSSNGSYTITGTVILNMGSATTELDVQDPKFIAGINSGAKYYFTFTKGIFRMDNTGTLNDAYNSGSSNALTISYGATIESDNGTMNLANNGGNGSVLLSGRLLMNGGTVKVQMGQANDAGNNFDYYVNGGTPQLYINSGSLSLGSGLDPKSASDYLDFEMTGGSMLVSANGHTSAATFELQDVTGGKTLMSGGLIVLRNSTAGMDDLDMGGANVAKTLYSVTGGTVQLGDANTENDGDYFGIQAYPTTNYPNIDMEPGIAKTASVNNSGSVNMLSLKLNTLSTFQANTFTYVNITGNNTSPNYALDDEGTLTTGTIEFSGSAAQIIRSTALSSVPITNLQVANTSGNVVLDVPVTVTNQLSFTNGKLDASAYPLTISNGAKYVTTASNNSYVITGDGVTNTGYLAIQALPKNVTVTFPIGTSNYYLPFNLNPGGNSNTAYSAFVYPGVTTTGVSNGPSVSSGMLANMADITWSIAQTSGSNSANLSLAWTSSGTTMEGSNFQTYGTKIGITQFKSNTWGLASGTGSVATETASSTFSGLTQFSVIGTQTAILPLVLGNFNAIPQGKTSLLTWSAFPDGQTGSFTIQRSLDGLNWSDIGLVQADVAATTETDYSFTDAAPATGQNDYRLFIQNQDGSTMYSSIKVVEFTSTATLTIYPNPANTTLTISIGSSDKPLNFRLVSTAGVVVQSKLAEAGTATATMNTGSYPAGVYYLEALDGAGQLLKTTAVMVVH